MDRALFLQTFNSTSTAMPDYASTRADLIASLDSRLTELEFLCAGVGSTTSDKDNAQPPPSTTVGIHDTLFHTVTQFEGETARALTKHEDVAKVIHDLDRKYFSNCICLCVFSC